MQLSPAEILALLTQADLDPIGLVVETNSPERLRVKLYNLKKERAPHFDHLGFVIAPDNPTTQLWIVHKCQKN